MLNTEIKKIFEKYKKTKKWAICLFKTLYLYLTLTLFFNETCEEMKKVNDEVDTTDLKRWMKYEVCPRQGRKLRKCVTVIIDSAPTGR